MIAKVSTDFKAQRMSEEEMINIEAIDKENYN